MKLLLTLTILAASFCVSAQESTIIGEWILTRTSPPSLNQCQVRVEYLSDGTSKSYNGDLVFTLNYDLEPHLNGHMLYLEIISHNGKKPCSGPPAELIEKNFLSYQYIEIVEDRFTHFLSSNPDDEFFMVFERDNQFNPPGPH